MTGGGLFDPLGADRAEPVRPALALSAPVIVTAVILVGLAALIAVSWFRDDGDRGEPRAVTSIEHVVAPPKPPAPVPQAAVVSSGQTGPGDQDVEIQNGVRIIRPRRDRPAATGETLRIQGPQDATR